MKSMDSMGGFNPIYNYTYTLTQAAYEHAFNYIQKHCLALKINVMNLSVASPSGSALFKQQLDSLRLCSQNMSVSIVWWLESGGLDFAKNNGLV